MSSSFDSAESSEATLLECPVCLEERRNLWPLACGHAFCRECVEAHVRTRVASNDALHLKCLNPICRVAMSNADVQNACVSETVAAFETQQAQLRQLQSKRRVVFCSTPTCDNRVLNAAHDDERLRFCDVCEQWTCVICKESHANSSPCVPPPANCLRCPLCAAVCVKVSGCNLVKCRSCSAEFCALCQKHAPDGYRHFDTGDCQGKLGSPALPELCAMLYCVCFCAGLLFFLVPFFALGTVVEFLYRVYRLRRWRQQNETKRAASMISAV
jgi:hypothetical protein